MIDFYSTPGGQLPHPSIEPAVLRLIERAICAGWELIRTKPQPGFDLNTAKEDEITAVLGNAVCNRILSGGVVPGFSRDLFRVTRENKVYNFNGTNLEKMPDLFFHLINDRMPAFPDQDGLFVECKPVDATHSPGGKYCDLGLSRFIEGDYAWTMQDAMMIGYAVTGYDLPDSLARALEARGRPAAIPTLAAPAAIPQTQATRFSQQPHFTTHERHFNYRDGRPAPPITVSHLWLLR